MAASFLKVTIGDQQLDELSEGAILDLVEIRQELNQHFWCDIQCRQTPDKRFPAEDCLGKDLLVTATDEEGETHTVFDGFLLEAELGYEISGSFSARLTGVTRSYKLDLTPRHAYYLRKDLEEIASQLTGLVGLDADLGYIPRTPKLSYVQGGETDFQFLKRLADDHECWIRPKAKGLQIYNAFQEGTTVQWREEEGLRNFRIRGKLGQPSMNGSHYQASIMESRVFQEVKDEPQFFEDSSSSMVDAVKSASKETLPPGYVYQRARAIGLDDYETLLKKESVRAIGSKITGWGESRNEGLQPGDTIQIEGELDAKGTYGLTKVIHRWTADGYMNEFWCTPWQNYTNPEAPKMREWVGVVPGRVVANNDPAGAGRVQIKFFWQEEDQTIWTRAMTPHAGADRGFYFVPEIGDEVVVCFIDGDLERPMVLGSIWNGVDKAPTEAFWGGDVGPNDVKRIITKSGHRFSMVDKKDKESIGIATPVHAKIVLYEKTDETGRPAIQLCVEDGDIVLSAPNGRIHFHAKYWSREVGS